MLGCVQISETGIKSKRSTGKHLTSLDKKSAWIKILNRTEMVYFAQSTNLSLQFLHKETMKAMCSKIFSVCFPPPPTPVSTVTSCYWLKGWESPRLCLYRTKLITWGSFFLFCLAGHKCQTERKRSNFFSDLFQSKWTPLLQSLKYLRPKYLPIGQNI